MAKPSKKNLTLLVYYTDNINSSNFWEYEHSFIVSSDDLHYNYSYTSSSELKNKTQYKVGFIWRDSAYNYSFPTWRITEHSAFLEVNKLIYDNSYSENLLRDDNIEKILAL